MNLKSLGLAILVAGVLAAVVGCREGAGTSKQAEPQVYQVKGVVHEVMPARKKVRIEHETIPNYMEAMTMDFEVKNTNELTGLAPGDQVSFRMLVTDKDGWIDQVRKTGVTGKVAAPPDSFVRVREVDALKPGDIVPDYQLTNQMGQLVKFSDFRGQALAFTFIFTRCPFPTFCPRMSSHFAEAQKQLKSAGITNWHLLTISFDPDFDTPETLKAYAKAYDADQRRWTFATGQMSNIVDLAQHVGLMFFRPDPSKPAGINHNLRTIVVDTEGRLQKIFPGDEWKPEDLVAEMLKAAKATPASG